MLSGSTASRMPFHYGKQVWFATGSGSYLHIIQGAPAIKEYDKKQQNISWEDLKGTKMEVTLRVHGVKQIYLQDPDRYRIEINEAKD